MPPLPLKGVRVLDFSRHLPGPFVTAALSDLGAAVTKIEERSFGDPTRVMTPMVPDGSDGALHAWLNRGKKSVAIDLKSKEGLALVRRLVRGSDLLVESFRPGVMKRLQLDYPRVRRVAPRLLYVSLSGYGADGPKSKVATHDLNVVGEAGLLSGEAGVPPGLPADTAASLLTLVAILAHLKNLGLPGYRGAYIDVSILDGALALIAAPLVRTLVQPERRHDELWGTHACYRAYLCSDGERIAIGAIEPQFWKAICDRLHLPHHAASQWSRKKQPTITAELEGLFKTKTRAHWMSVLGPLDACVTPVLSLNEVIADPQTRARRAFLPQRTERGTFLSPTFLPQITARTARRRAPRHGEHTDEVLRSLGYSRTRIKRLRETGVIQ